MQESLAEVLKGEGYPLFVKDWRDPRGVGDVVFELQPALYLAVEVKWWDSAKTGHNARVDRTEKRRKVFEQAVKYGLSWQYGMVVEPGAATVVATFMPAQEGASSEASGVLDVIMWLNSRKEALVLKPESNLSPVDCKVLDEELQAAMVARKVEEEWSW
ncbi:hypothetical protein HYH03_011853 [Edaphochlamys debaryana]|uniref:Uncharacterized protein n=1 Tax=Edaphochlamys debaryana TaxID=47281 RepID=A0A836BUN0_9CHLO|nr:hypothetical protein HYH03_011853 [Edaphochlamys debaryana]|eukprot:KAG2489746.1 hypothetical protein HYH03_011853 [Edaphochlamys debaryana]